MRLSLSLPAAATLLSLLTGISAQVPEATSTGTGGLPPMQFNIDLGPGVTYEFQGTNYTNLVAMPYDWTTVTGISVYIEALPTVVTVSASF